MLARHDDRQMFPFDRFNSQAPYMPPDGAWLHSTRPRLRDLSWPTGQHELPPFLPQGNAYGINSGYASTRDRSAPRLPPPTMDPSRLLHRQIPMPTLRAESVSESELDIGNEGDSDHSWDRQLEDDGSGGWGRHPDTIGMGTPNFHATKMKGDMRDAAGVQVPVAINAVFVLKKKAARQVNCLILYRRNYFGIQASYGLNPPPDSSPDETLYLYRDNHEPAPIQNLYMCMRGVVEREDGPDIKIVVFNAKRKPLHEGQEPPPIEPQKMKPLKESTRFYPKSTGDRHDNLNVPLNHTFPRNQFRAATQNNGARRSDQQFYHILLELEAEIIVDGVPERFVIASRMSEPLVVRGRCPLSFQEKDGHTGDDDRKGRKPPRDRRGDGSEGGSTTRNRRDRRAKGASRRSTRASSHLPSLTYGAGSRRTDTGPVTPQSISRPSGTVNGETLPRLDRKLLEHQQNFGVSARTLPFLG